MSSGDTSKRKSKPVASKKAAKASGKEAGKDPPKRGRPSIYTDEIASRIIEGLCEGTPLTIICRPDDMPGITTVWEWGKKDPAFSEAIARAREVGWDVIAMDALRIADNTGEEHNDTIETAFGSIPNKEWIMRSKLRVETRLKLLSKWDSKRYGEKITTELSGPDGGPIQTESRSDEDAAKFAAMLAAARNKIEQA
ncbi:MAG: hypothetical protein QM755_23785 [Luteolibacter sp.]